MCAFLLRLTSGGHALIDEEDAERVCAHRWRRERGKNRGYVYTYVDGIKIKLHAFVINAPSGVLVDHKNGLRADNRKANLRYPNRHQHVCNRVVRHGKSPFRGVYRELRPRHSRPWCAQIKAHGKNKFLGSFATPEEAARAYDNAARETHGDYAVVNFPQPGERQSGKSRMAAAPVAA